MGILIVTTYVELRGLALVLSFAHGSSALGLTGNKLTLSI